MGEKRQKADSAVHSSTTSNTLASDGGETSSAQNQKTQTPSQSATRGAVGQNEAMTVMVLNAAEPFEYESTEPGGKMMFHATVATKKVNPKNTIYEIKDDAGNTEVVGSGKCYNVSWEVGDKL